MLTAAQGAVQIMVGDCRETLAALPEASVDCIVTSPPYYGLRDYGHEGQIGLEQTPAAYVAEIVGVMRACRRVLKPGATLWINLGDSYAAARGGTHQPAETLAGGRGGIAADGARVNRDRHDGYNPTRNARAIGFKHKDLMGIPWRVAFALQDDGWWLRSEIIWAKPNPMPESVRDRPTKAHEQVFLLSNAERYFYDQEAIKEAAKYPGDAGYLRGPVDGCDSAHVSWRAKSQADRKLLGVDSRSALGDTRNARTVWTIATEPCDLAHFALMPTELARRCILAGCPKGGVVLDPFGGGGTTGLAAARHGRRAILCELNPEYAEIARDRIAREWREKPVKTAADAGPLFEGSV